MTHTADPSVSTPAADRAQLSWVPWLAIAAGAALLVKAALIIGSGDKVADAPLVAMYFGGIALMLVAAVGAGLRLSGGLGKRVAAGIGLALASLLFIMSGITEPVFGAMSDAVWVEDEGPIGLLGLVYILLGARSATRQA